MQQRKVLASQVASQVASQGQTLRSYSEKQPCSYLEYLGKRKSAWVHPEEILSYFDKANPNLSYENFVKQNDGNELLQKLILEDD